MGTEKCQLMIFVFSLDFEVLSLSGSHGGATTEIEEVGLENELQRGQGRKKKRDRWRVKV